MDPDVLAPGPDGVQRRVRLGILVAIALGGMAGTPARYALGRAIHVTPGAFPWATFTVNVTGSLALGMLLTLVLERWPPSRYTRPFAAIGFLGSYTTFSAYAVEADVLVKDRYVGVAVVYLLASPIAGLLAVYAGVVLARLWPRRKEER